MLFEEIKVGMKINPQTAKGFSYCGTAKRVGGSITSDKSYLVFGDGIRMSPSKIECTYKSDRYAEFTLTWDDINNFGQYRECINRGSFITGDAYLEESRI